MDTYMDQIIEYLMTGGAVALGTGMIFMVRAGIKFINSKQDMVKLELSATQEAWIRDKAKEAVLAIEESMAGKPGTEKNAAARSELMDLVTAERAVKNITGPEAARIVSSVLPELGLGAAVKEAAKKAKGILEGSGLGEL